MRLLTVTEQEAGQRLDRLLAKYMQKAPKSFFYKMFRKKNIKLNGKKAEGMERLQAGDKIALYLADATIDSFREKVSESVTVSLHDKVCLDVVYEDEHILVINKPIGILSQKADRGDVSIIEHITEYLLDTKALDRKQLETFHPGVCNRLDRNTSGLMVAGKTVSGLQWMNQLFRERNLQKYYLCIVSGEVEHGCRIQGYLVKNGSHNTVTISQQASPDADAIETEYMPLSYGEWDGRKYTLLKVHLITGKSHQIRAHLQSIGHPIIGDGKYGRKDVYQIFKKGFGLRHQLLHAWQLHIDSPEYLPERYYDQRFQAAVPEIFTRIASELGITIPVE